MTILVVMGVSGSGKTTIGQALARRLGYEFIEGDEFHTRANREKMHAGIPLNDDDRAPWLAALRSRMSALVARDGRAVLTCSALKKSYRDALRLKGVRFIYLKVSRDVLQQRLERRRRHFFNPALLESQLAILEEPRDAIVVDADASDLDVVGSIVRQLSEGATNVARSETDDARLARSQRH